MESKHPKPILTYHTATLFQSDLDFLEPKQWINDALLDFAGELYFHNSSFLYIPVPTITLWTNIDNDMASKLIPFQFKHYDLLIFPINDNINVSKPLAGNHWSLLIWSKADKKFFHFDSLSSRNLHIARSMVSHHFWPLMSQQLSGTSSVIPLPCASQNNAYDCGVYVLILMKNISEYDFSSKSVQISMLETSIVKSFSSCIPPDKMRSSFCTLIRKMSQKSSKS